MVPPGSGGSGGGTNVDCEVLFGSSKTTSRTVQTVLRLYAWAPAQGSLSGVPENSSGRFFLPYFTFTFGRIIFWLSLSNTQPRVLQLSVLIRWKRQQWYRGVRWSTLLRSDADALYYMFRLRILVHVQLNAKNCALQIVMNSVPRVVTYVWVGSGLFFVD